MKKNNTWNSRCLVNESFVPATQRIILKIVGFMQVPFLFSLMKLFLEGRPKRSPKYWPLCLVSGWNRCHDGDWKVDKEYLLVITWQSILVHIFVYRGMLLYDWIAFGTWFFWNNFYNLVHSALSLLLCGTSSKDQCIKLCKKNCILDL